MSGFFKTVYYSMKVFSIKAKLRKSDREANRKIDDLIDWTLKVASKSIEETRLPEVTKRFYTERRRLREELHRYTAKLTH